MNQTELDLLDYISQLTIIDTHEHLDEEERFFGQPASQDMLGSFFLAYFAGEIGIRIDPGESGRLADPGEPLALRWHIFEPVWESVRYTGTGQVIQIAASGVYGVDQISRDTIGRLNENYLALARPGLYKHVLSDLCRIKVSINDMINGMRWVDNPLFRFVIRLDPMVCPANAAAIIQFGRDNGVQIRSLADYEQACLAYLDQIQARGAVGLKCGLAYLRPLFFEMTGRSRAEEDWSAMMASDRGDRLPSREFQNYMMHWILAEAERRNLVLQVHTGILAGRGNLANTDPALLNNLFIRYPDLKFDLFHIGFPFHDGIAALARMFPNVFVDMCWAHVISPQACVRMLEEWLECIPVNKIMGFGGDYVLVAGVYGHLTLARRNIAKALAAKVGSGLFDMAGARYIARQLLFDNPNQLFKLGF